MVGIRRYISEYSSRIKWLVLFCLLTACVDPITFEIPKSNSYLVVEGLIHDQAGPYIVKLSRSFLTTAIFNIQPVAGARIWLYSGETLLNELTETEPGVYATQGVTGVVGQSYHITIETSDGARYESAPETMRAVGALTAIRAEFEAHTVLTDDGEKVRDRFNIHVDGNTTGEDESFVRWRFTGTYLVRTNPELYGYLTPAGIKIATPPECSGYRSPNGVDIERFGDCTCCTCWITERDKIWHVGAGGDVNELGYRNVFVGQAEVNPLTFFEKYHVQVDQMSISPMAYRFFRQLTAQTEGVGDIFQPATGAIHGNITAVNSGEAVLGIFYASSIKSISKVLDREDVPYFIPPPDSIKMACTNLTGASNKEPDFWQ